MPHVIGPKGLRKYTGNYAELIRHDGIAGHITDNGFDRFSVHNKNYYFIQGEREMRPLRYGTLINIHIGDGAYRKFIVKGIKFST